MHLGVHIVRFPWQDGRSTSIRDGLLRVADASEGVGATGLSLMDHYLGPPGRGPVEAPTLEGYTTLAFLAAATSTLRLRLLVTGITYRYPGVLAKVVTTLDHVSGGRAELGLGAAWYRREHRAMGVPFPPLRERFERLEETLQICLQMWGPDNGPYRGRHYQLAETICSPRPLSRPHPRIMVGGGGEQKTLALVARYADACNLAVTSPAVIKHKLDVLRWHCNSAGRSYDDIAKTIVYRRHDLTEGRHERFLTEMSRYATLGVDEVFVLPEGRRPEDWIQSHCGAVISRLADLGPR